VLHSGLIPVLPLAKIYSPKLLLLLGCEEIDKISHVEEKHQFQNLFFKSQVRQIQIAA
jgi:hypothetical protein